MIRSFRLIAALIVGLAVSAGAYAGAYADGGVPLPSPAKATGATCVEPADIMRRNHMDFLKQQRDETMHLGIRDGKYALNGCVECHATDDPKTPAAVKTIEPFCGECHAYAAVKLDCWSCHTDKPATGSAKK
jgi:hypothetical protein